MSVQSHIAFPPFRLDITNEQLWRDTHLVGLRHKTFTVLRYLVAHPGQLVTKEAMLEALWPGTVVTDSALKICVRELRKALDDDDRAPRFIQTVHGRGYRFIAPVTTTPPSQTSSFTGQTPLPSFNPLHPPSPLVGREAELARLHRYLEKALQGTRQVIFISGEPGIGKTTVVETFLSGTGQQRAGNGEHGTRNRRHARTNSGQPTLDAQSLIPRLWIGRGQCIEQYGTGEAYMPVLEALGRLCRAPGGGQLVELLGQHAPTWLAQMPALLSVQEWETLQRKTQGATRERMLREMVEAVEALTAEQPLILWLEDLHWSDASTLALLAVLARRQEAARLLVLGTYRPVEMLANAHPLRAVKQELQLHRQCEELQLGLLTEDEVAAYLAQRVPVSTQHPVPRQFAHLVHHRTEGNPLFMVNVVDYFLAQGGERRLGALPQSVKDLLVVPESIQQMIEKQLDRLKPEEQRVLEIASVAGAEFSAAAVAAGAETEIGAIETLCGGLVRHEQFLRTKAVEEWPDGTVAARYGFIHALYQEVLYERVAVGQRIALHRRVGEREEQAYGDHARDIAAELAMHFEQGREYRRAVQYRQLAGENALRRAAHVEAIAHFRKGLQLLTILPDTPERCQQELTLQTMFGSALIGAKGYAAAETGEAYARARELGKQIGGKEQLFPVLHGLWAFSVVRAELQTAHELAEQMLGLVQRHQDRAFLLEAYWALGASVFCFGNLTAARTNLERSIVLYDPHEHHALALQYGHDPGMSSLCFTGHTLWCLGYPEQALKRSQEAVALARGVSHPYSLAYALGNAAWLCQLRRETHATYEWAEAAVALSTEQGFAYWAAYGTIMRGWALTEQGQGEEGMAQMCQGLSAWQATGTELFRPFWLAQLAEGYGKGGQAKEGLKILVEALAQVDKSRERFYEAELYRLQGELTLKQFGVWPSPLSSPQAKAEACFLKAIEIARQQEAKSWELRAVMSLSRLWQQQDKKAEAQQLLAEIYGWFTEGLDTKDLQEAKALLEELT